MPGEYASKTDVPVSRSRDEIERTLTRFGATAFAYMNQGNRVAIAFEIKNIRVSMTMTLPDREPYRLDSRGKVRTSTAIEKDWEQACRQRWRTLANAIKAKLAMVDDGLASPHPGTEGQTNHLFAMATNSASIVVESSAAVNTIAGLLEGSVDPALVEELGIELPPDFAGLDLDLAVGPFPGIEEPGQGQIGGGAWYLTNGGTPEQQAAAWDFMKWFNSTAQQVRWAQEGSGLPVVTSAVEDPALIESWQSSLGGRWNEVAMEVLQNVDPDFPGPLIGDYKTTREAIRDAYERVLIGDGEIEAAIEEADAAITAAAEEYKSTVGG